MVKKNNLPKILYQFSLKTFQLLKSKVCLILHSRIQNFISDIAITFDAEFWNVAMKLFSTKVIILLDRFALKFITKECQWKIAWDDK